MPKKKRQAMGRVYIRLLPKPIIKQIDAQARKEQRTRESFLRALLIRLFGPRRPKKQGEENDNRGGHL